MIASNHWPKLHTKLQLLDSHQLMFQDLGGVATMPQAGYAGVYYVLIPIPVHALTT